MWGKRLTLNITSLIFFHYDEKKGALYLLYLQCKNKIKWNNAMRMAVIGA
jgi:hypothetical protein